MSKHFSEFSYYEKQILNSRYYYSSSGHEIIFSLDKGLITRTKNRRVHKWMKDDKHYPFCLKCGLLEKDSARTECTHPKLTANVPHTFKTVQLFVDRNRAGENFLVDVCYKCGILPECVTKTYHENISPYSRRDHYILNPFGENKMTYEISCNFTDDEWDIKDVII